MVSKILTPKKITLSRAINSYLVLCVSRCRLHDHRHDSFIIRPIISIRHTVNMPSRPHMAKKGSNDI